MAHLVRFAMVRFMEDCIVSVVGGACFSTALVSRAWHVVVAHLGLQHRLALYCIILLHIMGSPIAVKVWAMFYWLTTEPIPNGRPHRTAVDSHPMCWGGRT